MKPLHKIDLMLSVNGKIVAIQPINDWTIKEVVGFIKFQSRFYPERDCRIKPRREGRR